MYSRYGREKARWIKQSNPVPNFQEDDTTYYNNYRRTSLLNISRKFSFFFSWIGLWRYEIIRCALTKLFRCWIFTLRKNVNSNIGNSLTALDSIQFDSADRIGLWKMMECDDVAEKSIRVFDSLDLFILHIDTGLYNDELTDSLEIKNGVQLSDRLGTTCPHSRQSKAWYYMVLQILNKLMINIFYW